MKTSRLKRKSILLFLWMLSIASLSYSQNYTKTWYMDGSNIDFTSPTPTPVLEPGSFGPNPPPNGTVNNGVYGATNNLLFYNRNFDFYDRNGNVFYTIPYTYTDMFYTYDIVGLAQEMIITPVPGECDQYYAIYELVGIPTVSTPTVHYTFLFFTKIDMSLNSGFGDNVTAQSNVRLDPTNYYVNRYAGLAIGKENSGTRYFYASWNNMLQKYDVTNTGVTLANSWTLSSISGDYNTIEMDLSPDQSMLALANCRFISGSPGADVNFIHLDASGDLNTALGVGGVSSVSIDNTKKYTGVEFSPDNSKLFVGVINGTTLTSIGIKSIDIATLTPSVSPIFNSTDYGNSQLETAYDASGLYRIYAGKSETDLGYIDPVALTFTTGAITSTTGFVQKEPYNIYTGNLGNYDFFLLPDQIDDENYDARFVGESQQCCFTNNTFSAITYTVSGATTQTWTPTSNPFGGTTATPVSTVTIKTQLVIPAGYNVTIQGMTFKFLPRVYSPLTAGAGVLIERSTSSTSGLGGKLTLDNSVFTSYDDCGVGMWEGIEVRGYPTISQSLTSNKQGWLIVKNSSRIENAYHGVVASKITSTFNGFSPYASVPSIDNNYNGAVVQVSTQSRFKNNYIDVFLASYDFPTASIDNNYSSFTDCFFETTASLNDPGLNLVNWFHHALVGVKGISYVAASFKNADPTNPDYDILSNKRGMGIVSLNSNFNVARRLFTPFTKSSFTNLTYGIYAFNFAGTKTFAVNQALFTDNYRGIYAANVNYESITSNIFTVNRWPTTSTAPAYGIYLDRCKGFKVQENDFSYAGASTPIANSYGIIINHSNFTRICGQGDEIYKNTFHSILAGGRAQGNNSEKNVDATGTNNPCYPVSPWTPNNVGLVFKCNKFYSNVDNSDLSITRSEDLVTPGNIAYQQGYISPLNTAPAGNEFSHTSGAWDFFSQP